MSLPGRLFISYAVVIVIGAVVAYVTVRLLAPTLFDHQMTMLGGSQMGTATPAAGTVTIDARTAGQRAQVSISDTGVGLAAGYLERVFERFYRAPGQPRRSSGSGIGLTIARNIAPAHSGEITVSSAGPGRGATFVLTLPLRAGAPAPAAP